jgi:hypothetical protein
MISLNMKKKNYIKKNIGKHISVTFGPLYLLNRNNEHKMKRSDLII